MAWIQRFIIGGTQEIELKKIWTRGYQIFYSYYFIRPKSMFQKAIQNCTSPLGMKISNMDPQKRQSMWELGISSHHQQQVACNKDSANINQITGFVKINKSRKKSVEVWTNPMQEWIKKLGNS